MSGADYPKSKAIPLREWTQRALETADISGSANESSASASSFGADSSSWPTDIRKTLAVSSGSYLSSALKVARSLADQVCEAGENGCGERQRLLSPGPDWADRIAVYLSSNPSIDNVDENEYEGDFQPLPFSNSADPRELQNMLNSLIPDSSLFTREDGLDEANIVGDLGGDNIVSYHSVAGTEFLPSPKDVSSSPKDDSQRIYSLGIVFYELFSGGERYPDSNMTPHSNSKPHAVNGRSDGIKNGFEDPISHDQIGSFFDLSKNLNIFDQFDDNGDQSEKLDDSQFVENIEEQMPKKKKGPRLCNSNQSASLEQLKLKGLPTKLCDLIGNMIDCINGVLSEEEAYSNMSDVRDDLQLMLDKPSRFLHDIDIDKLSVTGLELKDAIFGREMEFSALQTSHRRAITGGNELAIIVGPSGIGKSVLARRLGNYATSDGGLFLCGKFDQLQQTKPFSALAFAFNQYCDKMLKVGRSSHLQEVGNKLRLALGTEAHHLVKVIPNLSIILGENAHDEGKDCVDGQKRIQYLLCQFLDVISSFSGGAVTLFLDDLQWADPASISAINQLLMVSGSLNIKRQFFFLGSCREEGLLEVHPFGNMLPTIRQFGVNTTIVKLDCMDKTMTNTMVSELLCLSPRLTRTLSELIHHKSKGNPLFFSQLMLSLHRDGLLRLSLSRRRWEWDEEKIQSRKLPDDVATFLTSTIGRLSQEVQTALCTLSCFGASSDYALIEALESRLETPIIDPLEVAVAEGLLNKINDCYSFSHDRLQEAAYNMIRDEDRCIFHFKYGVALVPRALELQDDSLLFTAASQLNRGGPAALKDAEQSVLIANLNLTAGKKATEMSDFSSAYSFFDNGISFLRKRHWQEHYELSLELFESASQCALVLGDVLSLKLLSEQILTFSDSLEDKLNAMYNTVSALAYASQIPAAVKKSILVLSQLGEELPDSYEESKTKFFIDNTMVMLQGFTDQDLIEYKLMDDPAKIMAMKFYARLELSFQMIRPDAQPIVTMKMVQLSIARGMSPMSPIGFTYFGQLLARLGNVQEGCRYVRIARELQDRIGSKEVAGEVIATGTQIMCFVEPVQTALEFHVQGQTIAMAAGDTHAALLNILLHITTIFWSGTKLPICSKEYAHAHRVMEEHNHLTWLSHMVVMEKNISILMSTEDGSDRSTISDSTEIQGEQDQRKVNPHASYTFQFQKMYICFMLREYEPMKAFAEKYFDFNLHSWSLLYLHTEHAFYGGLVSFWVHRHSNDPKWIARGCKAKFALKKWAESSEHNFQHKVYLLEAEEAFCDKNVESAESLYDKAISAARNHRFIHHEAMACELAGYFYLECDKKDTAVQHFMQAHQKYHDWGALAKCNAIFEFVQQVISPKINLSACSTPTYQSDFDDKNVRKRGSDWLID